MIWGGGESSTHSTSARRIAPFALLAVLAVSAVSVSEAHATFASSIGSLISNNDNEDVLRATDVHSFTIGDEEYVVVLSAGSDFAAGDSKDGLSIFRPRATDSGLDLQPVVSVKRGDNDPSGTAYSLGNPRSVKSLTIGSDTYLLVLNGAPSSLELLRISSSGGTLSIEVATSLARSQSGNTGDPLESFFATALEVFMLDGQPHALLASVNVDHQLSLVRISASDISVVSSIQDGDTDTNGVEYRLTNSIGITTPTFTITGQDGTDTYAVIRENVDAAGDDPYQTSIQILSISTSGQMAVASTLQRGNNDADGNTFDVPQGYELFLFTASGRTYVAVPGDGFNGVFLKDGTPLTRQHYDSLLAASGLDFIPGVSRAYSSTDGQRSLVIEPSRVMFSPDMPRTSAVVLVDVTDPTSPLVSEIATMGESDGAGGKFDLFSAPRGFALMSIGEKMILAVASAKTNSLIDSLDYEITEQCPAHSRFSQYADCQIDVNGYPDNQVSGVQFVDVTDLSNIRAAGSLALPVGYDKVDHVQRTATVLNDTFVVASSLPSLNVTQFVLGVVPPYDNPTSGLATFQIAGDTEFASARFQSLDKIRVSLSNDVSARGGSFDAQAWQLSGPDSAGVSISNVESVPGSDWQLDVSLSRALSSGDNVAISFSSSPGASGMPTVLPDQPTTAFDLASFTAELTVPGIMSAEAVSPRAIKVTFSEPVTAIGSADEWSFRGQSPASVAVPAQSFRVDSAHAELFGVTAAGPDFLATVEGSSATAVLSAVLEFDSAVSAGSALSYSPADAATLAGVALLPHSAQVDLRSSYSQFLDTAVITAYVAADSGGAPEASIEPAYSLDTFARLQGARDVAIYETEGQDLAERLFSSQWKNVRYDPETGEVSLSEKYANTRHEYDHPNSRITRTGSSEVIPSSASTVSLAGSVGTFAVVASTDDNGLQIINVTDPYSPLPVSAVADGLSAMPGCAGRTPPDYCTLSRAPTADAQLQLPTACENAVQTRSLSSDPAVRAASNRVLDRCLNTLQEQSLSILRAEIDGTQPGESNRLLTPIFNFSLVESLGGVRAVDLATIGGLTFAVAASYDDGALQIIGITDPRAPVKYGSLTGIDSANDVSVFSTGGRHYAIVTSEFGIENYAGAAVIVDITDPVRPVQVAVIEDDDTDADDRAFAYLGGPTSVDTFESGGAPYAAVTSYDDAGIQIMDLSDPANPKVASSISAGMRDRDGSLFADMRDMSNIATFESDGLPYAAVSDDFGTVQVVGLADPGAPRSTAVINLETSGANGRPFVGLELPRSVDVLDVNGRTLAAVSESVTGSLFLADLTDPASPENVAYAEHGDYDPAGTQTYIYEPYGVALYEVDGRLYAAVANSEADPARPLTGSGSLALMDLTDAAGLGRDVRMVKVGALAPLTGSVSSLGLHWEAAMRVGERDLNRFLEESGADWRLSLQIRDSKADPATALAQVEIFDARGMKAIIGPATSGSVSEIRPYVQENDMTILSYGSTAPSLALDDNVFRLVPPDSLMGPFIAEQLVNAGMQHVTIAYRDDPWGRDLAESIRDSLNERLPVLVSGAGASLVESVRAGTPSRSVVLVPYSIPVSDAAAVVSEMAAGHKAGNSAVLLLDFSDDAVSLMSAADAASSAVGASAGAVALGTSQWFGTSILDTLLSHTDQVRDFASRVKYTSVDAVPNEEHPDYARVTRDISARLSDGHDEFGIYTYAAYDAVHLMGRAVLTADSANSDALKNGIPDAAHERVGLVGDNTMDENGDLAAATFSLTQVRDGVGVPIEPYDVPLTITRFEVSSPVPGLAKVGDEITVTFETEEDFYYTVRRNAAPNNLVNPHNIDGGIALSLSGIDNRMQVDGGADRNLPTVGSALIQLFERATKSFTGRVAVSDADKEGPLDFELHINVGGATVTLTEDHLTSGNIVIDKTAPQFDSAVLSGSRALTLFYTEPVTTTAADYTSFEYGGSSTAAADSVYVTGESVLVQIAAAADAFESGDLIRFDIYNVTDPVGNPLFNEGTKTLVPAETGSDRFTVRDTDLDGFADFALPPSTLLRAIDSSDPVKLDVSLLPDPASVDARLSAAPGERAQLEADLTVRLSSATISLPAGLQAAGLGADEKLPLVARPQISLTDAQLSDLGVDPSDSATLLEIGDQNSRIELSVPVRIDFGSLQELVYVIDTGEARLVQECPSEIAPDSDPAQIAEALASLEGGDRVDAGSCFVDSVVWTTHFTAWGTGLEERKGGSECDDCTAPTLGIDESGRRIVSDGFAYNGRTMDVEHFFTPYPLITAEVGEENVVALKAYEESGPSNISRVSLAFGLRSGEVISESRAVITYDMYRDGTGLVSTVDPDNALDLDSLRVETQEVECSPSSNLQCLSVSIFHTFRAPLEFDIVGTDVWDVERNAWQNYFNHGIRVTGESLNPEQGTRVNGGTLVLHPLAPGSTNTDVMVDENHDLYRLAPDGSYQPLRNMSTLFHDIDESMYLPRDRAFNPDRNSPEAREALRAQVELARAVLDSLYGPMSDGEFGMPAEQPAELEYVDRAQDAELQAAIASELEKASALYSVLFANRE